MEDENRARGALFAGEQVGHHYDSYTPWEVTVSGLAAGEHEVAVRVDNSFGAHSALHIAGNDYYSYGGITRPAVTRAICEAC